MRRAILTLALLGLANGAWAQLGGGPLDFTPAPGITVLAKAAPGTTTAGTSEECLYSTTVTFASVGDTVEVWASSDHAANTNNAAVTIRMGQGTCTSSTSQGSNACASSGCLMTNVVACTRISATDLACTRPFSYSGTTTNAGGQVRVTSLNFANAVTIGVTGTTATAAGDVTLRAVLVRITM